MSFVLLKSNDLDPKFSVELHEILFFGTTERLGQRFYISIKLKNSKTARKHQD